MNSAEPDWGLYRSFLAVAEEGSLSGAARRLALAQPTVARQIDALEAALGRRLFLRSRTGLSPTEAGLAILPHAETLAATCAALLRAAPASEVEATGSVRISASMVTGIERLPPILASIRRAHPRLTLELVSTDEVDDLLRRDADVAVRHVQPSQAALVARKLRPAVLGFFARDDYLERRGMPASLADLAVLDLVGYDRETPAIRTVLADHPELLGAGFALRADNQLAQLAAIRAGYGIGICQAGIAARDRRLIRVLPDFEIAMPVWVVMHEDLRAAPRCRAVFDALVAGLDGD